MTVNDMVEQAYKNGYEAGSKHGYTQGYKDGLDAREKLKASAFKISDATRYALHKMDQAAHNIEGRSCVECIDGGIDMPHCSECNPKNGFAYFRKKV